MLFVLCYIFFLGCYFFFSNPSHVSGEGGVCVCGGGGGGVGGGGEGWRTTRKTSRQQIHTKVFFCVFC